MSAKDIAKLIAAAKFVESMEPRADVRQPYPLWYGWALREAFLAGIAWQKKQRPKLKRKASK